MKMRPIKQAKIIIAQYPNAKRILVIGVDYKSGRSPISNSPSLAFTEELRNVKIEVIIYDPLVTNAAPFQVLNESD